MALSLALHGLALVLLFAAGAAGSSTEQEPALFVELALVAPAPSPADEPATPAPEAAIELAPPDEPPPVDLSHLKPVELPEPEPPPPPVDISHLKPVELPEPEPPPPPVDTSELKPAEPPKPAPPPPKPVQQKHQAAKAAVPKHPPPRNVSRAGDAQQAAAGFLPTPAIVWEGKPRFRQSPTPAVYPSRAIELNQQGEVLVRVRLDPQGSAVEIVVFRSSGFELLDRSALKAVRGWRFLPAVRNGRPVAAWVEIPVRFKLR